MQPGLAIGTEIRVPSVIPDCNSFEGFLQRVGTRCHEATAQITGDTETVTTNVFAFTGPVRIVDQWAVITDTTAITNATNVYADIYDGTNTVLLTADGMTLSGATVGAFFTKDKLVTDAYSLIDADQCRMLETLDVKKIGRPFLINGKNGVTNYIRFHVTTNTTLDFSMFVHFEYQLLNGATLEFA
jgi:hypothetical protein